MLILRRDNKIFITGNCGEGHISKILENNNFLVRSTDLINRGFGEVENFFNINKWEGSIVTNPPYSLAEEFIRHSLDIVRDGDKVCMFLPIRYLEGKKRRKLFEEFPPIRVWVSSSRIPCAKNGDFDNLNGSAVCYSWWIWEKGNYSNTELKWFN